MLANPGFYFRTSHCPNKIGNTSPSCAKLAPVQGSRRAKTRTAIASQHFGQVLWSQQRVAGLRIEKRLGLDQFLKGWLSREALSRQQSDIATDVIRKRYSSSSSLENFKKGFLIEEGCDLEVGGRFISLIQNWFALVRYLICNDMDKQQQAGVDEKQHSHQMNAEAAGSPHGESRGDEMDPSNPIGYIRDPHRLITYLIPFPKPTFHKGDTSTMPERFLVYTPPPPPLLKPAEGTKEGVVHKMQRKWQEEIREAQTSTAKTASWKGIKSKAFQGMNWAIDKTTTSNLDYLGRVADNSKQEQQHDPEDKHAEDGVAEEDTTKKTVGVDELVLVYPTSTGLDPNQIREEFVKSLIRTKTKAEGEAIIATALLPVSLVFEILTAAIWPFPGLGEIDVVWAYATIRGAKTARSVTKRLSSSENQEGEGKIRLKIVLSEHLEVMRAYLAAECHRLDPKHFPGSYENAPTEDDVLRAIAWSPSETDKNWEDEQWEVTEVKTDLKSVMKKGAKEWIKWCKSYQKNPETAVKK